MLLSVLTNPSSFNFYKYWIVDCICQAESFNPYTQVMVRKIKKNIKQILFLNLRETENHKPTLVLN